MGHTDSQSGYAKGEDSQSGYIGLVDRLFLLVFAIVCRFAFEGSGCLACFIVGLKVKTVLLA